MCVTLSHRLTLDPWSSDLDQLREIMKTTGTPTQEFISKLESEDVSADDTLPGLLLAVF